MSIIKPKKHTKETKGISLFPVFTRTSFASFVGKTKFLISKIYLQVFNITLPTFSLTYAIS